MDSGTHLNAEGEDAWLRLKRHLEWAEGFALGIIFSDHPQMVELFKERLADIYRARVTRLHLMDVESSKQLIDEVLHRLLSPAHHEQALSAPCWLDLSLRRDEHWDRNLLQFLARLNEHRESLRNTLSRPLVLILPARERERIRGLVPDLWAIRTFSVDTGAWTREVLPETAASIDHGPPAPFELSADDEALVTEWRRVQEQDSDDRGAMMAAVRASEALFRTGRIDEAMAAAQNGVSIARRILERVGETPEALRDLSVSLNNVGQTEQALGRLEPARDLYSESLDIARRILERVGETPEALRDISVSLDNVGQTEQALGRIEAARDLYSESLDIRRLILERVGETPRVLRDLTVSLNNVGTAEQALGRLEPARDLYLESLDIARRILERVGETPEVLRDLFVILNNLGKTEHAVGRLESARDGYSESLDIARRILERVGETPEALRYLSVSLNNMGNTEHAIGRLEPALDLYSDSLDIARRILERVGETPEALRDLSVSLDNVGKTEQALGRQEETRRHFEEGMQIGQHLSRAYPAQTDYRDIEAHFQKRLEEMDTGGDD